MGDLVGVVVVVLPVVGVGLVVEVEVVGLTVGLLVGALNSSPPVVTTMS